MRAHALSSNLTTMPSFRCTFFAVRTMIACLISPLLTLFAAAAEAPPGPLSPIERDFWTTTIIRSPYLLISIVFVSVYISLTYPLVHVSSYVDSQRIRRLWLPSYRCNLALSAILDQQAAGGEMHQYSIIESYLKLYHIALTGLRPEIAESYNGERCRCPIDCWRCK